MNHADIAYRDFEFTGAVAPVPAIEDAERKSLRIAASCPECRIETVREVVRGLPSGTKGLWREEKPTVAKRPEHVTIVCRCGYPHAGRDPASTETGCGVVWKQPLS